MLRSIRNICVEFKGGWRKKADKPLKMLYIQFESHSQRGKTSAEMASPCSNETSGMLKPAITIKQNLPSQHLQQELYFSLILFFHSVLSQSTIPLSSVTHLWVLKD